MNAANPFNHTQPNQRKMNSTTNQVNLICMSFDGEYVTEGRGFPSIESAWDRASNMGSRWFFYPFCFVTTESGKTIKAAPEQLEWLVGYRTVKVASLFAETSKQPEAKDMDCGAFTMLLNGFSLIPA